MCMTADTYHLPEVPRSVSKKPINHRFEEKDFSDKVIEHTAVSKPFCGPLHGYLLVLCDNRFLGVGEDLEPEDILDREVSL